MGVFVTPEGHIYVADTGNGRIVHLKPDGSLNRILPAPQAELEGVLPANFNYRPLKVGVDEHGRIYVIAQDLYEGFISFSADGQFRGFLGAPRVTPSLADYLWSRFATKEQRQRIRAFLPTEYTNFDLDPEGFIYATSHAEDKEEDEGGIAIKIRRINAKGEDLLRRLGFSIPMGMWSSLTAGRRPPAAPPPCWWTSLFSLTGCTASWTETGGGSLPTITTATSSTTSATTARATAKFPVPWPLTHWIRPCLSWTPKGEA